MYHFFLVDFKNDKGYMYRVGIENDDNVTIDDIKQYFKQYANEVLYEYSTINVHSRYLKTKRKTSVGNIFSTVFLFDKNINVPADHWSCRLRRKILPRQNGDVYVENEQ